MPYEIIGIPEQYQFITEVPEFQRDLPDNVYLDKVSTGCGATFAVLTNDVNYVVVVPFISLGENKNEVLRKDLAHLYQVLDLPKLSDISLAFETSTTKYKGKNAFRLETVK